MPATAASLTDRLKTYGLMVLPQHALTRLVFWLTRQSSSLTPRAIRWFVQRYDVDLNDAAEPDLSAYPTFNAFFTRALKDSARPVTQTETELASPADGRISATGAIEQGQIFQAKGIDYSLADLLGGDQQAAQRLSQGSFANIYLSPRDYHRLHMPLNGRLLSQTHVPGRLHSVGPHTVRALPGIFARNERVIAQFETPYGLMALVLVGAMNVAAIETVWHGLITPPKGKSIKRIDYTDQSNPVELNKGAEVGRFNMGSTIIFILENTVRWRRDLQTGEAVRMGQFIGQIE